MSRPMPGAAAAPGPFVKLLVRLLGDWVLEVDAGTLRADAAAGVLGAVLVLPQAIAFATLAGLPPEIGLYTAVVPCIVAALAGSSRHVMSGPTNALSLALLAMLAPLATAGSAGYLELAFAVTLLVGVMQLAVALLRLGSLANFISPSVLLGFTAGASLLIALHALKDALGLAIPSGLRAMPMLGYLGEHLAAAQPMALVVAGVTLVVTLAVRRLAPRWPAMLAGLLAGSATVPLLTLLVPSWSPAATVGPLPSVWPRLHVPAIDAERFGDLLGLAAALTIVALGQSLAIAKALSLRTGQRLDVNREFAGQGLSNLAGGLFSCYVSCGSLNRSLPNLEAGARTPLAGVAAALVLLLLVALSAPLLAHIALPAIAALLLLISWSLLDLPRWRRLLSVSRRESFVAGATAVAAVVMRLEMAILLGTMLALLVYLHRTARPAMRSMGFDSIAHDRPFIVLEGEHPDAMPECPQLKLLRMEGSVYFGAVPHVAERLHQLRQPPRGPGAAAGLQKHLLVMSKSMNFIDVAGAEQWQAELDARRAIGGDLYFHRPRPGVMEVWQRTGFLDVLGRDHIFPDKRTALATIVPRLDPSVCDLCTVRLFQECPPAPPGVPAPAPGGAPPARRQAGDR